MGKSKSSKRFVARRPNPILEIESDISLKLEENGSSSSASAVVNIIEQLHDPVKEERALGCQHLARIVSSHPKAIKSLLEQDVIKITAPLFLDSCPDVQRSSLGAMRNLSLFGEEEVCDMMVKNDVLTPLTAVIKKFGQNFDSGLDALKREMTSVILLEGIELLSNLCENSNRAVQMFNKERIVFVLLPLLNTEVCGYSLSNAVAHCLQVVSENNSEVSSVCKEPTVLSQLMNIMSSSPSSVDAVLFRTRIIGTLLNLNEVDLSLHYNHILEVAGQVLEMDYLPLISLSAERHVDAEEGEDTDDISKQDVDKLIAAQRDTLEMVANLCCFNDEWEDMEEDCDDAQDCLEDSVTPDENIVDTLCLPSEIQSAFMKHDITAKVMKKADSLKQVEDMLESFPYGKTLLQRLEDLQARALLCLSNLISALFDSVHSQPTITSVWTQLYGIAKLHQEESEDFMWALTSAMRSVVQKIAECDEEQLQNVSEEDLNFLVQMGRTSMRPETQINVIHMISSIGCAMAGKCEKHHIIKTIGEVLLQVCGTSENVVVISETLDSIFDIFREDETDPVAKEIGLVQHLKLLQPVFKTKVSSSSKDLGEQHGVVMMARANFAAFLKYKIARHL